MSTRPHWPYTTWLFMIATSHGVSALPFINVRIDADHRSREAWAAQTAHEDMKTSQDGIQAGLREAHNSWRINTLAAWSWAVLLGVPCLADYFCIWGSYVSCWERRETAILNFLPESQFYNWSLTLVSTNSLTIPQHSSHLLEHMPEDLEQRQCSQLDGALRRQTDPLW